MTMADLKVELVATSYKLCIIYPALLMATTEQYSTPTWRCRVGVAVQARSGGPPEVLVG